MDFRKLIQHIQNTHTTLVQQSVKAVNVHLTIRNWLVGYYIVEYQQQGEDRARYGAGLLTLLAKEISIKGLGETNLKLCRLFYTEYPQVYRALSSEDSNTLSIRQTLSDELYDAENQIGVIRQTLSDEFGGEPGETYYLKLVEQCSFSHFAELLKIDNPTKRKFYELLILKTTPSVRELKREIDTLAFERVGLSDNAEVSLSGLEQKLVPVQAKDMIKSHYFFDFLGLKSPEVIEESELEQALIDHLQQFIIELGNGFCFEARQKRILIGDEYYHVDLVFYHRVLKCHILIELKTEHARHEHIGQLKVYLEHYKRKVRMADDNPPVGILLVTGQNKTLVEYAIADADKEMFVSQYKLELPKEEELRRFIENELRSLS